jgi:hypothetical protein
VKIPVRCLIPLLPLLCCSFPLHASDNSAPAKTLVAFSSERELEEYLARLQRQRQAQRQAKTEASDSAQYSVSSPMAVMESITNTQTEGVDEGGIVKVHGRHLVVLRRGRLFTIELGDKSLRPVAWTNAYGPGVEPSGAWYDEMLIHENRIVVIGYSYQRGGTEVALFDIDAQGRLQYNATYHLRSNDYYSSRNYASRLTDGKLIFYTGSMLSDMDSLPSMRRWPTFVPRSRGKDKSDGFARIVPATRIYHPVRELPETVYPFLHTITTCDLRTAQFSCQATGVVGSYEEVFYVSNAAVYVWTNPSSWPRASDDTSLLYRLPLDGSPPTALQTFGSPVDQFSFLEYDGYLNVLVGSNAGGAWMWSAEANPGKLALLRVPLTDFDSGSGKPETSRYFRLPTPKEDGSFQNRFVGEQLLYGYGSGWYDKNVRSTIHVLDTRTRDVTAIPLSHGVDRIEALGTNAIVIGADDRGTLHFSGIDLDAKPTQRRHFGLENAAQAELRSHGFFYSPNTLGGAIGLPIRAEGSAGWRHLRENAAGVVFLRIRPETFEEAGLLLGEAKSTEDADDGCQASCVDWYGNARPIFLQGRIFALLGYELVEGRARDGRLVEHRRVDFSPYMGH